VMIKWRNMQHQFPANSAPDVRDSGWRGPTGKSVHVYSCKPSPLTRDDDTE